MDAEELDLLAGSYVPRALAQVRRQVEAYEFSDGIEGNTPDGYPVVILSTRSAAGGSLHKTPLPRIEYGGVYYGVVAPDHDGRPPEWYDDVLVFPTVRIQDGPRTVSVRAREISDELIEFRPGRS